MFKNRALIWAKVESQYGTDPVPTKAANAILTDLPEIEFVFKKMDRMNVKTFLGTRPTINLGESLKITFNTEIKGCGDATPSIPPEIGVLFVGCGMDEDIVADTSYTYHPQDSIEGPSITIYFYQADILHKLIGCRGTFSIDGTAGEYGKIKWEFTGLYDGPTDSTAPTDSTYNATLPPALKAASFTLGAFAGTIGTFKLALGNEIVKRPDANAATGFLAMFIKERKVTAEIDPEAPALSTYNPVAVLTAGTSAAMSILFGASAGNKMTVSCPKVVLDGVKYAEREGILTYALPLLCCPNVGEDDVSILFS
jgi:hypothetical protein